MIMIPIVRSNVSRRLLAFSTSSSYFDTPPWSLSTIMQATASTKTTPLQREDLEKLCESSAIDLPAFVKAQTTSEKSSTAVEQSLLESTSSYIAFMNYVNSAAPSSDLESSSKIAMRFSVNNKHDDGKKDQIVEHFIKNTDPARIQKNIQGERFFNV